MDVSRILYLEAEMDLTKHIDLFTEGADDLVVGLGAKISAATKKICAQMTAFAQEMYTSITNMCTHTIMNKKMAALEKKVKAGEKVTVPDFEGIVNAFRKDVSECQKEIRAIAGIINHAGAGDIKKFEKYDERKEELEKRLDDMVAQFAKTCDKKITIDPEKGQKEAERSARVAKLLVAEYMKLVRDLEKLTIQFQKITTVAEASYEVRVTTNTSVTMLGTVQRKSTKMLRKAVFLVCSFVV